MNKELSILGYMGTYIFLHQSCQHNSRNLSNENQEYDDCVLYRVKHILLYHNRNTRKHKKRSTYKRSLIYIYIYLQVRYRRLHMPKIFLHHPSCKLVEFDWPRKNAVGNCYLSLTIIYPNGQQRNFGMTVSDVSLSITHYL